MYKLQRHLMRELMRLLSSMMRQGLGRVNTSTVELPYYPSHWSDGPTWVGVRVGIVVRFLVRVCCISCECDYVSLRGIGRVNRLVAGYQCVNVWVTVSHYINQLAKSLCTHLTLSFLFVFFSHKPFHNFAPLPPRPSHFSLHPVSTQLFVKPFSRKHKQTYTYVFLLLCRLLLFFIHKTYFEFAY